ncbi:MAG: SGNH/GDSL hydrolase family protein [Ruminiclostridium sp.]|nr:SGNH/GDSL hydrolase family protein [Ruminiclostridium sp.]
MNMKKRLITMTLAAALLLTSGCNGSAGTPSTTTTDNGGSNTVTTSGGDAANTESTGGDSTEDSSGNVTEDNNGGSPDLPSKDLTEEQQREYMIEHSFMTEGDTSRMARVLKKAQAGEEITVGFIGGSITEGLTAGADACWAKLTYDALCKMFPNTKINYVNAGLSGTPSILGVVRAERDLFGEYTPDIVFIEFAVNDGGDQMYKDCYESLVKKCLEKENSPAVALLFTVLKNRYSCQEHMSAIGEHYNLPMMSVGNAINPMFDAGLMEWEKYSDDESHPNFWGHELVKDFVMNYINKVNEKAQAEEMPEPSAIPDTALNTAEYSEMKLLERDQMNVTSVENFKESDSVIATFKNGWQYRGKEGASLTFTAEFKTLFLVFRCNNTDAFADAEVYVDGELAKTLPSNKSGGWGNPEADLAWNGESGTHTVEIKIAPSDKAMAYGLCGVGIQ